MKSIIVAAIIGVLLGLTGCGTSGTTAPKETPSDAQSMGTYHAQRAGADWVQLPDGTEVLCVFAGYPGGVSCDWDRIR